MVMSRRSIIRNLAAGTAVATASPWLAGRASLKSVWIHDKADAEAPIRLDRNENAYGPSPIALAAMHRACEGVNRYPDKGDMLQEKLAALHAVKPGHVVLGCGSSEILRMAAEAFLGPGKRLVLAQPTFNLLAHYAQECGAIATFVPLKGRAHDLQAMLKACDAATGLVYICNPNNPTGGLTGRQELEDFLRRLPAGIPVVMDEAYHHYVITGSSVYASFIDRPVDDDRLIVTRTFSKIYGLAGLRIGYALAPLQLAQKLSRRQLQFGVNVIALQAATAALDDTDYIRTSARRNIDDRQEFANDANLRRVPVSDSQTNFVLMRVDHPVPEIIEHFRQHKILIGPGVPGMDEYVRISLGQPDEMQRFWRVWDLLPHDPRHSH